MGRHHNQEEKRPTRLTRIGRLLGRVTLIGAVLARLWLDREG